MRTLGEIIDAVKEGGKPEYDELRYSVVALSALRHFDAMALMNLAKKEREGKYRKDLFGLDYQANQSFNRFKAALAVDPKTYVGPDHDPDTPECQRFRKMSENILRHVINKSTGTGADNL